MIYDASELKAVVHQYEGTQKRKRDGFIFKDINRKKDSLLAIIKIHK